MNSFHKLPPIAKCKPQNGQQLQGRRVAKGGGGDEKKKRNPVSRTVLVYPGKKEGGVLQTCDAALEARSQFKRTFHGQGSYRDCKQSHVHQ